MTLPHDRGRTICLNMIVRNEAPVIRRCLDSVMPLIDSWTIVDTGSTDGTQEIIRAHLAGIPGELFERPWVNFAHNRSEALQLARGKADYLLVIDADEILERDPGFVLPELTADAYDIEMRYGGCSYLRRQLVKASLPWRYIGVVHEYIHCDEARGEVVLPGLRTVPRHDGARARDPKTYRRDALLLENALLEEPDNTRYVFYLAQSYRDAGDLELAIRHYRRRAEMGGGKEEVWFSLYQIAMLRERLGHPWPEVMQDFLAAHQLAPDRAGPLYRIGMHYQALRQYALSHVFFSQAMRIPMPGPYRLFVERPLYEILLPVEHSVACYYVGDHESAIEVSNGLLRSGILPASAVGQVMRNRRFSLDALLPKLRGTPLTPLHLEVVLPFDAAGAELDACLTALRGQSVPFHASLISDGAAAGAPPDLGGDSRFTVLRGEHPRGWEACVAAAAAALPPHALVVPLRPHQRLADPAALARIRDCFEDAGCALLYGNSGGAMPPSGERAFAAEGAALAGTSTLVFRASLLRSASGEGTLAERLWRAAGWQQTRFLDDPIVAEAAKVTAPPMISCLLVTRDRLELAKRSIRCFAEQTWANRELVIVTDGEPEFREALLRYAKEAGVERCRLVLADSGTPLGLLRNISIDAAAGDLVCQWDDDDAYHPERLTVQAEALLREGARASFFTDHLQYLEEEQLLFWIDWTAGGRITDQRQFFPGSLMMFRDPRFRYPESGPYARRGEDSVLLAQLMRSVPIARISGMGHLYLYHYHGANTFDRDHHYRMSACAAPGDFLKAREATIRQAVAHYGLKNAVTVAGTDGAAFVIGPVAKKNDGPRARDPFARRLAEALSRAETFRPHVPVDVEIVKEVRGHETRLHCVDVAFDGRRERYWVKAHVRTPRNAYEEWSFLLERAPFHAFDLAEPVAYLPELELLVTRHAEGESLQACASRRTDEEIDRTAHDLGAWLGSFHRSEIGDRSSHPAETLVADVAERLTAVARTFSIPGHLLGGSMNRAREIAGAIDAADLRRVRTHGDFGAFNVLVAAHGGTILDPSFDPSVSRLNNYCTRHEDVARFLVSLAAAPRLPAERQLRMAGRFRDGYREAGGVDPFASPAMSLLRAKYGLQAILDQWPPFLDDARTRGVPQLMQEWLA
jgi:glycosyltransferase involved in cell wall biosynthesis